MKNHDGIWLPDGDTFFQNRGDYESHDYSVLKKYISGGDTAVDIGAHVGYWSRRLVKDYSYVVAFEAAADHVECLERNVNAENFTIHKIALSNEPGTVKFSQTHSNSGMSRVADSGIELECEPLDRWKLRGVDLIKIDVEGHELNVLQGAEHTILRNRPVLFIEILRSTPLATRNSILDLLHSWNYVMVDCVEENYIFMSNNEL